jgi:hypothetical protein
MTLGRTSHARVSKMETRFATAGQHTSVAEWGSEPRVA